MDEWKLAIAASVVLLIKQLTELVSSWLTKEMAFRQTNRHAKMQLKLDLDVEARTQELKRQQKLEDKRLEDSLNANLLEDALRIQGNLRAIREKLNAKLLNISLYHNGVAKGFKNYSIRYEEARVTSEAIMQNYQAKPLSPFYSLIKEFEDKDALVFSESDTITDKSKEFVTLCKLLGATKVFITPLLIGDDSLVPSEHTTMVIKKNKMEYYLVGMLVVYFDKESKEIGELEVLSYLTSKADDLMNIYTKNPKVFG